MNVFRVILGIFVLGLGKAVNTHTVTQTKKPTHMSDVLNDNPSGHNQGGMSTMLKWFPCHELLGPIHIPQAVILTYES